MRRILIVVAVVLFAMSAAACGGGSGELTGRTWKLTAVTATGTGSAIPPGVIATADQTRYTITFKTDGTFDAKADCNNVGGAYTTSGNSITIVPGPSTQAACPPDSLGGAFVAALALAKTYAVGSNVLTLTLNGGSQLTFG
jgi:heat shock protein HslJ